MENNQEVLLRVDHLCQYFKMGPNAVTKAVDDVSFDIKKGEVFGLVGESGCGKTTTGRSIIKLYDITSGSVYFKGIRIAAGTQSYKDAIKKAQEELKEKSKTASPEEAAKQAVENDVHVVGVSSLAAGHLTLVPQIIAELKKLGREDIIVIVGGVIPAQDYDQLYKDGAAAIFGPGTPIATAAIKMLEILLAD